jgi:hypothetical protein
MRLRPFFAGVIACHLGLVVAEAHAQQAPRPGVANPARRNYYSRVQTQPSNSAAMNTGSRFRPGMTLTRTLDSRVGFGANPSGSEPDPLRAYGDGEHSQAGSASRPNGRTPEVRQPEPEPPPAPVSRNYYPGLRSSQSMNRNVAHCVPGRHSFLGR